MIDQQTREYLQGYGSALADFNRLFDQPVQVYEALRQASLDYHALRAAGLETYDLGEIARCRDAWKREAPCVVVVGGARRRQGATIKRETLTPDKARK